LADNPNQFVSDSELKKGRESNPFERWKTIYDVSYQTRPNLIQNESFGWHLQFLTILGISICTLCFTFGLLADITNNTTCFTIKNYIALVAAPIEIVISILYWGLRAIDTGLVVPP
jgi:hypothetical protein